MTNHEANRERLVRSIETRLRGYSLTTEQADRLHTTIAAATSRDEGDCDDSENVPL